MTFAIEYHEAVVKLDIPKLSSDQKERIKIAIEEKLLLAPDIFGKPLRRSLKGYRKLRVGDYRVVFRIEHRTIKVLVIEHRSRVYIKVSGRL